MTLPSNRPKQLQHRQQKAQKVQRRAASCDVEAIFQANFFFLLWTNPLDSARACEDRGALAQATIDHHQDP
jgi:hypothetical protein